MAETNKIKLDKIDEKLDRLHDKFNELDKKLAVIYNITEAQAEQLVRHNNEIDWIKSKIYVGIGLAMFAGTLASLIIKLVL